MNNASELVGNTATIRVPYQDNTLYLKLEGMNPGLSIKDRVAFYICNHLDQTIGLKGQTVVEYSSGNLAIGLAQASKIWDFQLTLIVTSKTSPDKIKLLQRFGVELIMVDEKTHSEAPNGFRGFAEIIAKSKNALFIDQFNNKLNAEAHTKTTAPEILRDIPQTDYVFCAMGTGGTASGVARFFKDSKPSVKVIGVTPDSGIYFSTFHNLHTDTRMVDTEIEGVGEDFIPANLHMDILSNVVEATDHAALNEVDTLIQTLGIFVGGSSGLALAAAKKYITENKLRNKNIVVLCPDSGNRYLSNYNPAQVTPKDDYTAFIEKYKVGKYPKLL